MFRSRPLRTFFIVGVILDLAVVGLAVGLHERAWAEARNDRRAERNDRFDGGMYIIQSAIFAWSEAHGGRWPRASVVTQAELQRYLEPGIKWPVNPL
jgi:hypothetical protein